MRMGEQVIPWPVPVLTVTCALGEWQKVEYEENALAKWCATKK